MALRNAGLLVEIQQTRASSTAGSSLQNTTEGSHNFEHPSFGLIDNIQDAAASAPRYSRGMMTLRGGTTPPLPVVAVPLLLLLTLAAAQEPLIARTCQDCESGLEMQCPNSTTIDIVEAFYGRESTAYCVDEFMNSITCRTNITKSWLDLCQGKSYCNSIKACHVDHGDPVCI